ncbi:MAG TPA: tRNA (N(6)-L-threonylcarbamoyladenosine(37)-C(2))-methylthiotransferase MtaB [Lachnospiraceae bacterium]|nr:tRNA (N(6)-L-threonylcarbamoyladenosine(37)-C(2))-methylthiotransferase MtaB [Lachnospiraceae bacterium]
MKTVALYNLGCKVNSYETEGMGQKLREKGYKIVSFEEKADIYIVNTCTVTNIADRKSRQMLHRAKQLNPDAVVVAVGCYVQTGLTNVEKDAGIDLAVGNNHKKDIVELLEKYLEERRGTGCGQEGQVSKTLHGAAVTDMDGSCEYEEMQLRQTTEHTRAYIKIQDGCNQFCSYCVIPYARGRVRSRRADDILQEIRGLVDAGCREVVLTGIHISSYGIDFSGNLIELIELIHEIPGLDRIRLGSLEPRIMNEETARRLAAMPKLCPHFHLSLQSGCDATLKRMNRHYTSGEYYICVETLRRFFDNPAITTDVIVGFPGETEEEFALTKAFLKKVNFYQIHVFKYSRRTGTAAAAMREQVPEKVKAQRSGELLELTKSQARAFREHYIGRKAEVLLEERRQIEGRVLLTGHTKDYVKIAVDAADSSLRENRIVTVPVKGFLTDEILI